MSSTVPRTRRPPPQRRPLRRPPTTSSVTATPPPPPTPPSRSPTSLRAGASPPPLSPPHRLPHTPPRSVPLPPSSVSTAAARRPAAVYPPSNAVPLPLCPTRVELHRAGSCSVHFNAPLHDSAVAFVLPLPLDVDAHDVVASVQARDARTGAPPPLIFVKNARNQAHPDGSGTGAAKSASKFLMSQENSNATESIAEVVVAIAEHQGFGSLSVSYCINTANSPAFDIVHKLRLPHSGIAAGDERDASSPHDYFEKEEDCQTAQLVTMAKVSNPLSFDLARVHLVLCDSPFRASVEDKKSSACASSQYDDVGNADEQDQEPIRDEQEREDERGEQLNYEEREEAPPRHIIRGPPKLEIEIPQDEYDSTPRSNHISPEYHANSMQSNTSALSREEADYENVSQTEQIGHHPIGDHYVQVEEDQSASFVADEVAITQNGEEHDSSDAHHHRLYAENGGSMNGDAHGDTDSEFDYARSTATDSTAAHARNKLPPFQHVFSAPVSLRSEETLTFTLGKTTVTAWRQHTASETDARMRRVLRVRNNGLAAIEPGTWQLRLHDHRGGVHAISIDRPLAPGTALTLPLPHERATVHLRRDVSGWRGRETALDVWGGRLRTRVERYRLLQFEVCNRAASVRHAVSITVAQQTDARLRGETEARLLTADNKDASSSRPITVTMNGHTGGGEGEGNKSSDARGGDKSDAGRHDNDVVTATVDDPPGFVRYSFSLAPGVRRTLQVRQTLFTESEHELLRDGGCTPRLLWRLAKDGADDDVMSGLRELREIGRRLDDERDERAALDERIEATREATRAVGSHGADLCDEAAQGVEARQSVAAVATRLAWLRETRRLLVEEAAACDVRRAESLERRKELLVEIWGMLATRNGADSSGARGDVAGVFG